MQYGSRKPGKGKEGCHLPGIRVGRGSAVEGVQEEHVRRDLEIHARCLLLQTADQHPRGRVGDELVEPRGLEQL